MLDKNKISAVVERFLGASEKFLVDVLVSKGNVVEVFVDGDNGISINECVAISRHIESSFDREQEDYELRVSSPGIDKPFKLKRQYAKYVNRKIVVILNDGTKVEGTLLEYSNDHLVMECIAEARKKITEVKDLPFSLIREGKPVISFR